MDSDDVSKKKAEKHSQLLLLTTADAITNIHNIITVCFTLIYHYINTFVTRYCIIKQKSKPDYCICV